jgi:cation diffusion facilitator CzcD-associated flavoprotein CzcO
VDFERFRGRRIAVLGHAASAFDNAKMALNHGAARVDLCFRRPKLPRVNPHRFLETAGTMTHFFMLPDAIKWEVACHFEVADQPPPPAAFEAVQGAPAFRPHPGCPWLSVRPDHDDIVIETPKGVLKTDHLLLGTGLVPGLEMRPELRTISDVVVLWKDRFAPAAEGERSKTLGCLPYVGPHYEFIPKCEEHAWVRRVFSFNFGSAVSHGPHSTSISGHKHCVPRLIRGITAVLFADQAESFASDLKAFNIPELVVPDGFEASLEQSELSVS